MFPHWKTRYINKLISKKKKSKSKAEENAEEDKNLMTELQIINHCGNGVSMGCLKR